MSREKKEVVDADYSNTPNDCPTELWEQIGAKLDEKSYLSFALSCRFFSKLDQVARNPLRLERLLNYVAAGQQDELARILKKHPEFLLLKGALTDSSGRNFPAISIFQYALWAWDTKYMAGMIIDCIPENQLGDKINLALLQQLEELEKEGLVYHFDGVRHCESHFNLECVKEKLSIYITEYFNHQNLNVLQEPNIRAALAQNALAQAAQDASHKEKWLELGKAQKPLPAYLRQEYCRPKGDEFLRTLTVKMMDGTPDCTWDNTLNNLGETFAIFKSPFGGAHGWKGFDDFGYGLASENLDEINLIHTARKDDFIGLKNKLQTRDEREFANDDALSIYA